MSTVENEQIADPLAALAAFLTVQVGELVDGRVFRPDLPRARDQDMPQAAIVLRRAGGYKMFGPGQLPVSDPLVDCYAYGSTPMEAESIAFAVTVACKTLVMGTYEGVLLYWAKVVAGPQPSFDTETLWPLCYVTLQLMHGNYVSYPA